MNAEFQNRIGSDGIDLFVMKCRKKTELRCTSCNPNRGLDVCRKRRKRAWKGQLQKEEDEEDGFDFEIVSQP